MKYFTLFLALLPQILIGWLTIELVIWPIARFFLSLIF